MFINISNHSTAKWSPEQLHAAKEMTKDGRVEDLGFPQVDPRAGSLGLSQLALDWLIKIVSLVEGVEPSIGEWKDVKDGATHLAVATDDRLSMMDGGALGEKLLTKSYWPLKGLVVHLTGEAGFCTRLGVALWYRHAVVVHSTTDRVVVEKDGGVKESVFKFVKFR